MWELLESNARLFTRLLLISLARAGVSLSVCCLALLAFAESDRGTLELTGERGEEQEGKHEHWW